MANEYGINGEQEKADILINVHQTRSLYGGTNVGIVYNQWHGKKYTGSGALSMTDELDKLPVKLADHIKENWGNPDDFTLILNVNHLNRFSHWEGEGYSGHNEILAKIHEETQELCPEIDIRPVCPFDVDYSIDRWDWRPDMHIKEAKER